MEFTKEELIILREWNCAYGMALGGQDESPSAKDNELYLKILDELKMLKDGAK